MECQAEKNVHFRHLLLFAFNRGFTAAKAARDICVVYGENAMAERTARYWLLSSKKKILISKTHLVLAGIID